MITKPSANGIAYFGQFAIDLLVLNSGAVRAGYIDCKYVDSLVGINAYDAASSTLSTAFEVYYIEKYGKRYTLLQIRSPVEKKRSVEFAKELAVFVETLKVERVVVMTGIDATFLRDFDCNRLGFKTVGDKTMEEILLKQAWHEFDCQVNDLNEARTSKIEKIVPPGAGVTNALAQSFKDRSIDFTVLGLYTNDGDNRETALDFTRRVVNALGMSGVVDNDEMRMPHSWNAIDDENEY